MPTTIPSGPFRFSDPSLGLSASQVRGLVRRGEVRRVLTGVGVRADQPDTVLLRAQAARLALSNGQVVVDHSAAWLHGVDVGPAGERCRAAPLEVADRTGSRATRRAGIDGCRRTVASSDVCEVHGVPTTTPLRTAADLACRRGRLEAIAVLDAFARVHAVDQAAHRDLLPRFAGRRGVTQYRELVPLLDARAESPRESWTRLSVLDAGLPGLEPQVDVHLPGLGWVRLDLADRGRRVCVEYDGADFHGAPEHQERDDRRRRALSAAGWVVVVVHAGDFAEPGLSGWTGQLRAAMTEPPPSRRRRYARAERTPGRPR